MTRRYFEKAEFAVDWPIQFLIIVTGVFLAVFEGSLSLWSVFYGATPLLSLIFLYWVTLHHEKFVTVLTPFLIGLMSDLLFSDLLGGRAFIYMMAFYYIGFRRPKLMQGDFMQLWLDFALVLSAVMVFQLAFFSLLYLVMPATTPILFQVGATLILFPFSYLTLFALASVMEKVKMQS
jgi:cell shape-determining protein MreD